MKRLEIKYINIKDIKPYKKNPRKNEQAIPYVSESIKQFGFKNPIIIDKNNIIVCGHTRYRSAEKLGIKEIPCIYADDLTEEQVKAFRLADNKVSDYATWDNKLLLEELDDLQDLDIFTGFEISDIFGEELNEKDMNIVNTVIDKYGVEVYKITYTCISKEQYEDILKYIECTKNNYE